MLRPESKSQEDYYRAMFEGNPLPMWVYDSQTLEFLEVNEAAVRTYGYSREEFLSMTTLQIQPPEYVERMRTMLAKPNAGVIHVREWQHVRRDGSRIDVEISSHEVPRAGRAARLVIVRDLTEHKLLEQERTYTRTLEVKLEHERELVRLKENFISVASHEFRTPLAIIASSADIIRLYQERLSPRAIMEKAEGVREQVRRMTHLLDDLLTLNRASAVGLALNLEPMSIQQFLQDLSEHFRMANLSSERLEVYTNAASDDLCVLDRRLLENIVINLISNSAKFSPVESCIEAHFEVSPDALRIRIIDSGIGIPDADHARIFDAFYRAGNVGTIEGPGLGLAIVRQCVRAMNGSISFTSALGQGTAFEVALPTQLYTSAHA